MIIKVCGMRDAQNIREVNELDIDMMGFIFYPKSPRYVHMINSMAGILPDYSEERLATNVNQNTVASKRVKRVGVFVDDMPQNIVTRVYNYQLDFVQLHGDESPVMIENLLRTLRPDIQPKIKVIKTISVSSAKSFAQCYDFEHLADYLLFDTSTEVKGGSGKRFDWKLLDAYTGHTPFILSGGIGPDEVDLIRQIKHPLFAGIDVNSRFETAPGVKDIVKLKTFITEIRNFYE